jgi:type III pantothenate kinase
MANLVIDIGNTYTKIAVFKRDELLVNKQFEGIDDAVINTFFKEYNISKAIISSVKKKESQEWQKTLAAKVPVIFFTGGMTGGLNNKYLTPGTLGADRLAGVIGAKTLFPDKNSLVISGGTCITYDWVDATGNYFGGSISPGLNMRYKALNYYTDGLPLVNPDESFDKQYGDSTVLAIRSGVQNGIKYELMGFIESYKKAGEELNIVLSGGDSIFFDTLLKNSIFAPCVKIEPLLVLKGLNAALQINND